MSIYETVKTQKWYYLHNMRSPFSLLIEDCIERQRERARERGYVYGIISII